MTRPPAHSGSGEYVRSVGARERRRTSFSSCHRLLRPAVVGGTSPATLGGALLGGTGRTSLRHAAIPPPYEDGTGPGLCSGSGSGSGSSSVSDGLGSRVAVRLELNLGRSGERGLRSGELERALAVVVSRLAIPSRAEEGRGKGARARARDALDGAPRAGGGSPSSSVGVAGRVRRDGRAARARGASAEPREGCGGCLGAEESNSRYRA